MECTCIPHTRLPKSSPLFLDYLYHFDRVSQFYNGPPFEAASYAAVAAGLESFRTPRAELATVLARQNQALGCGEATLDNIGRLSEPGTFAVVTGQQVGLFSGPAFTLYKALTAICLAQSLSAQGLRSVPVFWLATEDHDLEEVAQVATLDEEYELIELEDQGVRPAPRCSVGRVTLSAQIGSSLDRLEKALDAGAARDQLLQDLRASYQPGVSWGRAFGLFVTKLFSRWGVIMVDALDESLHRLSAPTYERAIDAAPELRARLLARSHELIVAGYHAQVHVGEDSTLLFLSRDGNRTALRQEGGHFTLDGSGELERLSLEDLRSWLKDHPGDFSANALLRPVVQDTLLPTLAYVAGPSELAYHGQAQTLYSSFGRPQPVIFPRASFTLIDSRTRRLLEKYHVGVEDVWQGEEHLARKIAAAGFAEGWSERLDQSEGDLTQLLERLRKDIETIDPTLLETLKHVEEKMRYQMERLKGKITRAALERSDLLTRHQQALLRLVMPRRDLQEREVSGAYFLGRAGYELLDRILSQIHAPGVAREPRPPCRSSDHQVLTY
jgi:bacillithiol biosynthesis cysteine-adding enzyme BshC